jgi:hypothetical protein
VALSQFHRTKHKLIHDFKIEIEEARERNIHGFRRCRLKQEQLAMR